MGDSPGSDRPLKRVRYAQQEGQDGRKTVVDLAGGFDTGTISPADSFTEPVNEVEMLDSSCAQKAEVPSPSQVLIGLSAAGLAAACAPVIRVSQAPSPDLDVSPKATSQPQVPSHRAPQPTQRRRPLPAVAGETANVILQPHVSRKRKPAPKPTPKPHLISPFSDCRDRLLELTGPRYTRPDNGQVNGYVKFNWPSRKTSQRPPVPETPRRVVVSDDDDATPATPAAAVIRSPHFVRLIGPVPPPSPTNSSALSRVGSDLSGWSLVPSPPAGISTPISPRDALTLIKAGEPRMVPPHFGLQAKMDFMDRRLWDFYVNNWCPGRSVLSRTNLWLTDFAQMHEHEGVRWAIQSLAGVYIYDYLPNEKIRQRINERYIAANAHFSKLLIAPESSEVGKGSEVITMAVILSMQDVVLTESRLKKPHCPRWLEGFRQGEHFLQATDPGGRFWQEDNVQLSNLRISQSIIVGRAVILAQLMMPLTGAETLDPEQEANRFGWLLYGTPRDMYEIHGGCGFSKKLLHAMSQVTYCAARLQQDPDSIVPITARYLYRQLQEMRQWSSESIPWSVAQQLPATIESVRTKPKGYIIDTHQEMTDVTAEAWRFAAIIYLQCRVFRLPRDHVDVICNLDDLARCIRIMPTSGSHFTAQAPLLPVFFLGLLAYSDDHYEVAREWFEAVVQTPVRSSVPPLYQALKRIWTWFDKEVKIAPGPLPSDDEVPLRDPWWERLVAKILRKEEETLCLT